jgi:hypothetical protein
MQIADDGRQSAWIDTDRSIRPTTTLPDTVTPDSTHWAPDGTIRLPLTVLPGVGFGGQVVAAVAGAAGAAGVAGVAGAGAVAAARAAGTAANMIPNATIAVTKCFIVSSLSRRSPGTYQN